MRLLLLDPASGETIADAEIVGPPTFFTGAGGRCHVLSDESSIYVGTGNGVVAAVASGDLSWKWATTYPSTLAARRSSGWWPPHEAMREFGGDRPVLAGDSLVLAPADGAFIFALDRFTGRQQWRVERRTGERLVGAAPAGVLVAGNRLTCLDVSDGETVHWRTAPLEITGRPAICGERVFLPTRDGVLLVNGRTGKVLTEPADIAARTGSPHTGTDQPDAAKRVRLFSRRLPTANLLATADALFAVTPNGVVKFPDLAAHRQLARRCWRKIRLTSGRASLTSGWTCWAVTSPRPWPKRRTFRARMRIWRQRGRSC